MPRPFPVKNLHGDDPPSPTRENHAQNGHGYIKPKPFPGHALFQKKFVSVLQHTTPQRIQHRLQCRVPESTCQKRQFCLRRLLQQRAILPP